MRDNGEHYEVVKSIKEQVLFRQFNLMETFPFRRKFHVIFMRNVMIYFDARDKKKLVQKIYDSLESGGYLFVGRTETIDRSSVGFEMIQPSIFRKPEERR
jgi:chemotaxis protein methyltransferase CheR